MLGGSRGRIVLLATMGGSKTEIDLRQLLGKRAQLTGSVLRARSLEEKIEVTHAFSAEVLPLFAQGKLQPTVDRVFSLADIAEAHRYMESNQSFGKIVLTIP